ncbi:MAG: carboxypeptidase-like regulatory domain-containing protein, partial [Acidobacteriota bacterium]
MFALGTGVAQEAPPMGAVSGRVVHGMTGEAVAKALVTLSTERGAVQAMTGADGVFRIPAAPGEYRLSATRNGFLRAAYRTRVKVEAGQTVSGIEFRMSPQSVVAGRVVDEDGDPVERAFVALVPARGSRAA